MCYQRLQKNNYSTTRIIDVVMFVCNKHFFFSQKWIEYGKKKARTVSNFTLCLALVEIMLTIVTGQTSNDSFTTFNRHAAHFVVSYIFFLLLSVSFPLLRCTEDTVAIVIMQIVVVEAEKLAAGIVAPWITLERVINLEYRYSWEIPKWLSGNLNVIAVYRYSDKIFPSMI